MIDSDTGSDGLDPTEALLAWFQTNLKTKLTHKDATKSLVLSWLRADILKYGPHQRRFLDSNAVIEVACRFTSTLIAGLAEYNNSEECNIPYAFTYESTGNPFGGAYTYALHFTDADIQFTRDGDTGRMSCEVTQQ